jgi:hypothetical protein
MLSDSPGFNPLGWVQVRLLGGPRRLAALAGIYGVVLLLLNVLFYQLAKTEGVSLSTFAGEALKVGAFLMAAVMLIGGVNAIKKAVQRDFTSDMITSHRLTAMTGSAAVIGYLTGATAQIGVMTALNWFACSLLALIAGGAVYAPTLLLVYLGCMAAMFGTLGVLLALSSRGAYSIAPFVVLGSVFAFSPAAPFLPGLSLLMGGGAFADLSRSASVGVVEVSVFVGMFAQLAVALAVFIAAGRKFTRDDVQAFPPVLAFTFLTLCALVGTAPIRFWSGSNAFGAAMGFAVDPAIQVVTTLAALSLVAFLPVASTAKSAARWAKLKAKDPRSGQPRPRHYLLGPLLAGGIVFGILALILTPMLREIMRTVNNREIAIRAAWAFAFFLLPQITVAGLLRSAYAASEKALGIIALYLVIFWALPPLADLALQTARPGLLGEAHTALLACSPVGAWIAAALWVPAPMLPGLILHLVLAGGALYLAHRAKY